MKLLVISMIAACGFWLAMFSPWTADLVPFWPAMVVATGTLAGLAIYGQRKQLRSIFAFRPLWLAVGVGGAALLYAAFWLGRIVSVSILDFAPADISGIYEFRRGASQLAIGLALLLWIGPAEEIFWRGFLQKRLADRLGSWPGYILATVLYAGVHVWALNFMLLAAAAVCGVFWGWLMLRYKSIWPGIISHAIWDVTIFVLLPLQSP